MSNNIIHYLIYCIASRIRHRYVKTSGKNSLELEVSVGGQIMHVINS